VSQTDALAGLARFGRWLRGGCLILCLLVVANLLVAIVPDDIRRDAIKSGNLYQRLATSVVTVAIALAVVGLHRKHWRYLCLWLLVGISFGTFYGNGLEGAGLGVPLGLVLTAFYVGLYFILVHGTGRQVLQSDRFLNASRWSAIIVAVLQLLLAGLQVWILVDLVNFGVAVRPTTFILAATFVAVQIAVIFLAWTLPRYPYRNLRILAWIYFVGLVVCGMISLTVSRITPWVVEPGARLPRNELFGSDWSVAVAWLAFALAQLLGIVPLLFVVLRLAAELPSTAHGPASAH
jgi:hypothetical protein